MLLSFCGYLWAPLVLLYPTQAPYIILGIFGLFYGHYQNLWKKFPKSILWIMTVFCLWGFLSSFWSIDIKTSLSMSFKLIPQIFLGLGWILFCLEAQEEAEKLLKPLMIGQIAIAIFILIDWIAGRPFLAWWHVNSVSAFGNVSTFMALTLFPISFWLKNKGQTKQAIAFGVLLFAAFATIDFDIIPFAVIIAGLVSGILYLLPFAKQLCQISIVSGLFLTPFITTYIFNFHTILLFNQAFPVFSYVHRLHIWHYLGEQIFKISWLGQGLNTSGLYLKISPETYNWNFIEKTGAITPMFHSWSTYPLFYHPHNLFLQLWYELHIVGVFLFSILLWVLLHRIFALPKLNRIIALSCFLIFLFFSLISIDFWYTWWVSTVFLATGILLITIKNNSTLSHV